VDEEKRDPLDFVLWKHAKPGEPSWESPWGPGRPGWHIECSAMSTAILGTHFDLHGGGMDLKFPHHENEIAQSCAATGDHFAESWMHNGFVNVNDEKMSKSLGNFFTVRDVLPKLRHPEVLRYFVLMSHYRGPINYSQVQLEQADLALGRLYTSLRDLALPAEKSPAVETPARAQLHEAMDDDFNTPEALAALQNLAREVNVARDAGERVKASALGAELRTLAGVLGILTVEPAQWFRLARPTLEADSGAPVQARLKARRQRQLHQRGVAGVARCVSPAPLTATSFGLARTFATTRRLAARPAGVELVSTGWLSP
jgi:cysteinyl-tRNA synthetase